MPDPNLVLTIAGSDPSGGAGLQADLAVFARHGLRAGAVVTSLTVQTSQGVRQNEPVPSALIASQLEALFDDHRICAAKLGMLGDRDTPAALAELWGQRSGNTPLVIDPVLVSSSGTPLLEPEGLAALVEQLLPLAQVLTPNLPEAAVLLGWDAVQPGEEVRAARALLELGPKCVVLTGGHREGLEVVDVVATASGELVKLRGPRIETKHDHGTGCLFSAGITAALAQGLGLLGAARHGRACVEQGLRSGRDGAVWLDRVPTH